MVVPKAHLLQEIDKAVDCMYIDTRVKDLYSPDKGWSGVDPLALFKKMLIQHLLVYDCYAKPSGRLS